MLAGMLTIAAIRMVTIMTMGMTKFMGTNPARMITASGPGTMFF